MFVRFSFFSYKEVRRFVTNRNLRHNLDPTIFRIAEHIQLTLLEEEIYLSDIKYYDRFDDMCNKYRRIGVQEPLHQIYDYVAVNGLREMLDARIGVFQCASLPGKGQSYGKKYIERWVRNRANKFHVKLDIHQCFPSISHTKLKELLSRYVKNKKLLWLVFNLIDRFFLGLSIGSYLSQYLSNFYLSVVYHYIDSELYVRFNGARHRLLNKCLFYMDDILIIGNNKHHLRIAVNRIVNFMYNVLGLIIKCDWKICPISDSEPIDMMGFVFRRGSTTIRKRIFIRARRVYLKIYKRIRKRRKISIDIARRCISAYGWFKHTNSSKIIHKIHIKLIHNMCRSIISIHDRQKGDDKYNDVSKYKTTSTYRNIQIA